ncbi:hypothetical protein EBZ80_12940 [bacterium]|nr:hypothetical protein [bacterium]
MATTAIHTHGNLTIHPASGAIIPLGRRVALDASGKAILAPATSAGVGVAITAVTSPTIDYIPITVTPFNLGGIFSLVASGSIAVGDAIDWAADGKVRKAEGAGRGRALTAAADGEDVQCVLAGVTEEMDVAIFTPAVTTQGDTGTASVITIATTGRSGLAKTDGPTELRVGAFNAGSWTQATNATIAATGGSVLRKSHTSNKDLTISEVQAVAATRTLTLTGVVVDGETVSIGGRVYEFDAHASSNITAGRVRVPIRSRTTVATGVLTVSQQPTAGETVTIGNKTFLWVANGTATINGQVSVGANKAGAQANLVAAINGSDSVNTAHTQVTAAAFATDAMTISAIIGGAAANSIATTEVMANGSWGAGTLASGADCTAANAITDLVTAITNDTSAVVTAVDGSGDTVDVTAKTAGAAGNSIALAETLANGSWAGSTLTGGISAEPGVFKLAVTNATAEGILLRFGPPEFGAGVADYSRTQTVTHAAP